jgi:cleavage stimulation factor subunit 3
MSLPPEDRNVNADVANPPFVAPGQEPDAPPDPGASQASARTEPAHDAVPDAEPPSEWDALRAELAARPFEPQRWYRLVQVAETAGETEKIRAAYDGLLSAYPNTVRTSKLLGVSDAHA